MGDSEITAARNYAQGAAGRFAGIDALPLTGQYTTYSLTRRTGLPDYVPDSAATGSAWSTGTKTYDNAVSVNLAGQPQQTLLELAKANGLKTGDVTTSELQDATPAVQVSHISARSCYGPRQTTTTCPRGGHGERRPRLDHRAAARHPARRHPGRWRRDVRRDGHGRAGGRARRCSSRPPPAATGSVTDKAGLAGRHPGRPGPAAARPLRSRQPAGALGRARRHRRRRGAARRRGAPTTRLARPPSRRWRR